LAALRGALELRRSSLVHWLTPESVLAGTLVLVIVYSSLRTEKFLSLANLEAIALQTAVLLILAVGQTSVVIARGFDLTVGSLIGLTSVIGSEVSIAHGIGLGAIAFLGVGALAGAINAGLIAGLGLSSVVVTLGGLTFYGGLSVAIGGESVTGLPNGFPAFGNGLLGPLPYPTLLALVVLLMGLIFLYGTRFGACVYAIGSNPRAAMLSGIKVRRLIAALYIISGFLAGLAGFAQTAIANVGNPYFGVGAELQVLAAVFIGGVSFYGGQGSLLGVAVGVVLLTVIQNALNLFGFSGFLVGTVSGVVLLAAILLQRVMRGGDQQ
jgi:ribose transport system permease protein